MTKNSTVEPPTSTPRSWTTLTVDELRNIVETGEVPSNLEWESLPDHPEFDRIFRVRGNPTKVAKILLEARVMKEVRSERASRRASAPTPTPAAPTPPPTPTPPPPPPAQVAPAPVSSPHVPRVSRTQYVPALSPEYREERLKIKKEELELQRSKLKNSTLLFEKVCQLETDVKTIKRMMKVLIDLLREMDGRTRRSGG